MKKKLIFASLILSGGLLAGCLSFALNKSRSEPIKKAEAATYTQSVTDYYSGFNWNLTGANLKTALFNKINISTAGWSYDGLWNAYKTTDVRPDGTHFWDIYADSTDYTLNDKRINASYKKEGDSINREHVIPQSSFNEKAPMKSDIHHVLPSDGYVNNRRSAYPHGIVTGSVKYTSNDGCKLGTGTGNSTVFEPMDQYKGDIARIYFYFVTCYQGNMSSNSFSAFDRSTYPSIKTAYLNVYLQWAKEDPVSQKEIDRNNAAYAGQGNRNPFIDCPYAVGAIWDSEHANDYGTKGEIIGGTGLTISKETLSIANGSTDTVSAVSSDSGNISWSSSNTNVATVSSNSSASGADVTITAKAIGTTTITASRTINGDYYSKTCTVTVTAPKTLSSISISGQKTSFKVGNTFSFGGTVTATYSDSSTANVTSNSTFSGYDMSTTGNQTVTVSYTEGAVTKTTTYSITVNDSSGPSETLTETLTVGTNGNTTWTNSSKTSSATTGLVTYTALGEGSNDGKYYSSDNSWRFYSSNTAGVRISVPSGYEITSVVLTWKTGIPNTPAGTTRSGTTSPTTYTVSSSGVTSLDFTRASANFLLQVSTVNYRETGSSSGPTLDYILLDIEEVQIAFYVGDTFSYEGLVVTAYYTDDDPEILESGYTVSSPNMSTTGEKTITVTYQEVSETYTITVIEATVASISATVSKSYYVGETISKDDITVKDNLNNTVTNFTFANNNYRFVYADANSGGASTAKIFENAISFDEMTCSLTVHVQRKNRAASAGVKDTITADDLAATTTSYIDFSGVSVNANSDALYAGLTAKTSKGGIQMKSKDSISGIVSTTSGGEIMSVKITVESGSNTINIYGKDTAYSAASDLYNTSKQGTLVGSLSSTGTITFVTPYLYVGIRSNSGAIYVTRVEITYGGSDTATNVANYIMYEDTEGQCNSKFSVAKGYFEGLSKVERSTFMTSSDYVIATARDRFEAWATYLGKQITYSGGDHIIVNASSNLMEINTSTPLFTNIVLTLTSVLSLGCLMAYKKRKKKQ